jgi:RNA polymerase sigma-70 factor (ECF subfamily)
MNVAEEQFGDIYDQYIEKIYRFVYLKVNSKEIAEDITSKVFLKGWENYQISAQGKLVPVWKNPGAFLYQIARNCVVDHYREKGRTKIVSADLVPNMSQPDNLHEKAVASVEIETIKTAILGLKKDYQDVIICHYIEDMPISQVAQIMKKSEGAVRVMLHRGLTELRACLRRQDVIKS